MQKEDNLIGISRSRRTFIKTSAVLATGAVVFPFEMCARKKRLIGLQLYTVRNQLAENLEDTLQKIAEIGYNILETAGYSDRLFYGLKPEEFKSLVNGFGMNMLSSHTVTELTTAENKIAIMDEWEKAVEDTAETGAKYLVYAHLRPEERKNIDDYKIIAEKFNEFGETCKNAGIQFAYRNHDFEFTKFDGIIPYDLLLNETDENLVKMQLDLYWVIKGGYDPVDYFDKYPNRFELWHVKDMEDSADKFFTEVGQGTIDFARIFKYAKKAGMKYFFVEQDQCKRPPLESIKISYDYLSKADFLY